MSENEVNGPGATSATLASRWHHGMATASFKGQGAAFWDAWVRSLPPKQEHSNYVDEVLHRINCKKDDAILDVGAGTGALSLPLAKCVRQVTALDQSEAMLETIAHNAAAEQISNIKLLHLDWTKAQLGIDFDQHDIVLVSRSLPGGDDVLRCLDLINRAARRMCYITWKADGHNPLEATLCTQLGIPYHSFPDYIVLRDIILSLGIIPIIELFTARSKHCFGSLEQAYTQIVRKHTLSNTDRQLALDFLADNLEQEDGSYVQTSDIRWALISWPCNVK